MKPREMEERPKDIKIQLRVSTELVELIDKMAEQFGLTRSEVFRCGAVSYCQSLMLMGSFDGLYKSCTALANSDIAHGVTEKDQEMIDSLGVISAMMGKTLGLE